jgi:hypothetical protein
MLKMSRLAPIVLVGTIVVAAAMVVRMNSADARSMAPAVMEILSSPTAPGSAEPKLSTAPDGRVIMSWFEPAPDSAYSLKMSVLSGTTWSEPQTVRTGRDFFVNWADFPSVVSLGGNKLAAHWLQKNGKTSYAYLVKVAQSSDGWRTWSSPVTPHTDTSETEHGFVSLWRDGALLSAVWLDGRKYDKTKGNPTNEMTLRSSTINARGGRGTEAVIDQRVCDCCQTTVAMTSSGPVVAYRDRTSDEIRDIYVARRIGGKWSEGVPVHNDGWKINACPVNGPSMAASGKNVALAWFTAARDTAKVNVAFSSNAGASFGPPIRVDGGKPAGRVGVAMLPDGSALVTWIERIGGDTAAVRARRVTSRGSAGPVTTIASSSSARASGFPQVALSNDHLVFAWTVPGKPSAVRVARTAVSDFR